MLNDREKKAMFEREERMCQALEDIASTLDLLLAMFDTFQRKQRGGGNERKARNK